MSSSQRTTLVLGFAAILGGLLLLAFTQVSRVLPDTTRPELTELERGSVVGEVTGVVISALLVTIGALLILGPSSTAPYLRRAIALAVVAALLPTFLVTQTLLVINGVSATMGGDRVVFFSASYLFHTGGEWSFAAVYILFFFNFLLVLALAGAIAYLLAPQRVVRALFDRTNWAKNEAIHIAATLFLLLSISVLFLYILRLAVETDPHDLAGRGLFGPILLPSYYLLALLLFGLGLTVAAHAFLLNWGSAAPLEFHRLVENIRTIARVERALLVAAAALNFLILLGPTLPSHLDLSQSFAFDLSPRGLSYAFYLLLVPYVPYVLTQRRLDFLLRAGRGPHSSHPFAERSPLLVLAHVLGLVVVTALAAAGGWDPLMLMLAMSSWTAGVLLVNGVRIESPRGLPRLAFRGEAGPAFYFVFLGLALTTGLMLWGSGNTYDVRADFRSGLQTLQVDEQSDLGLDVLARVAATLVIATCLVLTLDLWLHAHRVERRFLGHYLAIFLSTSLTTLLVFTVGVWTDGAAGLEDAYAGFSFHQLYGVEKTGAGLLLSGTVAYLFFAVGRITRPILEKGQGRGEKRVAVLAR